MNSKDEEIRLWNFHVLALADALLKSGTGRIYAVNLEISQKPTGMSVELRVFRHSNSDNSGVRVYAFSADRFDKLAKMTRWVSSSPRKYSPAVLRGLGMKGRLAS